VVDLVEALRASLNSATRGAREVEAASPALAERKPVKRAATTRHAEAPSAPARKRPAKR
jgi:hypothetical protein